MGEVLDGNVDGCAVRVVRDGQRAVVAFRGALCEDTARWAGSWLTAALAEGTDELVVDLSEVDLLCAAGVSLVVAARQQAEQQHVALVLVEPRRRTARWVLELCGVSGDGTAPLPPRPVAGRCAHRARPG
jgi:anti-anti-sigma factor